MGRLGERPLGKIHIMEPALANKIAAGEVVERPASVVKELVENAIDAKAERIEVEVIEGGLTLIRVTDDGEGMERDDLPLAFTRHATSKMLHERDLFHIKSLGFRGEALPSIAAVSKVKVASRTASDQVAHTLTLEGGIIKEEGEMPHPLGTSIWVRDLFYNTPARLKYMKSLTTENYHIQDILMRLAMAHPERSFRLLNDGREVFRTAGTGDLMHTVHSLYGLEVARSLIPIEEKHPEYTLTGVLGKPEWTRGGKQYLTFIVNGRVIRSLLLQRALLEGYDTLLPLNRYPFAVLSIRMDASLVDVNVHPAKWEARFSKEEELSRWISMRVRDRLLHHHLIPTVSEKKASPTSLPLSDEPTDVGGKRGDLSGIKNGPLPSRPAGGYPDLYGIFNPTASPAQREERRGPRSNPIEELSSKDHVKEGPSPSAEGTPSASLYGQLTLFRGLSLEPLAQLHDTYIVAQGEDGLYLIDQHAAQERINYEKIRKEMSLSPDAKRQILAIPYTYEVAANEAEYVREAMPMMEELGIVQEEFGERAFLVRELPLWFDPGEEKKMLEGMIQLILKEKGRITRADLNEAAIKQMACKASIKANQKLSKEEMALLLQELGKAENPYTCPHGRPILIHFSKYDLEKMFKRVM